MSIENRGEKKRREIENTLPLIAIASFAAVTVIMILLGIMLCELPVVMVCTIVIIETAIAMCLHNLPIWVHALVLAAEIIAGVLCGQVLFIIFAEVVYAGAIFALHFLETESL